MAEQTKSITFTLNVNKHQHILQKLSEEREKEGVSRYLRLLIEEDLKKTEERTPSSSLGAIQMKGLE